MMIKPPGNFFRARILKIHDHILIPIEIGFIEQSAGAMQKARIEEHHIITNSLAIESGKQRCRGGAIETTIMIKNFDSQKLPHSLPLAAGQFLVPGLKGNRNAISETLLSSQARRVNDFVDRNS